MSANARAPRYIDRNGTLCYNPLAIAGSPYTAYPTVEMEEDPNYSPGQTWWEKICGQVVSWWRSIPTNVKAGIGIALIIVSVTLAFAPGVQAGIAFLQSALVQLAIGIGVSAVSWAIGSAITGVWNEDTLYDSLAETLFFVGAFLFVESSVTAVKYFARTHNAPYKLDPRSIELAKQGNPSEDVFRQRVWQNEAMFNRKAYTPDQLDDMVKGLAPKVNGQPMHLHHVVGKSVDPYYVIKITPVQHTAIHKAIGYHVTAPKLPWTLENAIKYGGLT